VTERPAVLPSDRRFRLGGYLFLVSLLVFFVASILMYAIYAGPRRADPQSQVPLPTSFLVSTICLLGVSVMMHLATRG